MRAIHQLIKLPVFSRVDSATDHGFRDHGLGPSLHTRLLYFSIETSSLSQGWWAGMV